MRWIRSVLRGLVMSVLLVVCGALFYVLVIMGDSQDFDDDFLYDETITAGVQLAEMPQSTLNFTAADLYQAEYYFNDPLLKLSAKSGWTLEGVTVLDSTPEGAEGTVREIRLKYTGGEGGGTLYVSSITPASYLRSMASRGFSAASDQEWFMGGTKAVLMRSGDTVHVHMQRGDLIYQIEGDVDAETLRKAASQIEM